jgi:hypothetical protein
MSIPPVGPTHPHIHWVPGFLPQVKRPGRKADHSRPVGTEVKKDWSYRPLSSGRGSSLRCQDQLLRRDTKLLGHDRQPRSSDVNPGPCYAKQGCWELDGDVAGL